MEINLHKYNPVNCPSGLIWPIRLVGLGSAFPVNFTGDDDDAGAYLARFSAHIANVLLANLSLIERLVDTQI